MFTLLQPVALFAAAGIALPILVHLWNVRQGKTLKVGSIALIADQSSQAKRIRMSEWVLLLLRCLLILLAALLLAGPAWKSDGRDSKGWILAEPGRFREAYTHYAKTIDSLQQLGYELHLFDTTFRKVTPDEIAALDPPAVATPYPLLLDLLDPRLPGGHPVYLFTGAETGRFSGRHRPLHIDLRWKKFAATGSRRSSVAWPAPAGGLRVTTRTATAQGSTVSSASATASTLTPSDSVQVDTAILRIGIFAADHPGDAAYLEAALSSVKQVVDRDLRIVRPGEKDLDWLFWLSEKTPPAAIAGNLKQGGTLFRYASGKAVKKDVRLLASSGGPGVPLSLAIPVPASEKGDIRWYLSDGAPVLTNSLEHGRHVLRFYSRLDPAWNDLPWSAALPEAVMDLVIPPVTLQARDLRTYPFEYQAVRAGTAATAKTQHATKLDTLFWLILAGTFAFERWLSSKRSA